MKATEAKLQAKCFNWHWNKYHAHRRMLFHTYNNSGSRTEGAIKKALGVVAGVSDFVYIHYVLIYFIELKTEIGVQEIEQIDFEKKVIERGHTYLIIRSFEEFQSFFIKLYGY